MHYSMARMWCIEEFDLANLGEIHAWCSRIGKQYGRIYGLVNNAAIGNDGVLATMHETDIAQLLAVNLQSPILLCKYISRSMLLGGEGRIVNISSIIASTGFSGLSVYAATKAGSDRIYQIIVARVGQGWHYRQLRGTRLHGDRHDQRHCPCQARYHQTSQPLRQTGQPRRMPLPAVAYLLGEGGAMITGTTITVDAGSTA